MDYTRTKEIIHATSILSDEDTAFIDQNIGDIQNNWAKRQKYRTETEMRVSVLNDIKFPTPAAKYWQCVREQSVFYEQLVQESFRYQRLQIELEKVRRKRAKLTETDDLKLRLLDIKEQEIQFGLLNMQQSAKDRMREIRLWAQLMEECREADPTFDGENVDTDQLNGYLLRWHQQLQGLKESNSSVSEVNNLVGQYVSGLKSAIDRGAVLIPPLEADAVRLGVRKTPSLEQRHKAAVYELTASYTLP